MPLTDTNKLITPLFLHQGSKIMNINRFEGNENRGEFRWTLLAILNPRVTMLFTINFKLSNRFTRILLIVCFGGVLRIVIITYFVLRDADEVTRLS